MTAVERLLYASGSGVYGDIGEIEAHEDRGPLLPICTYGASKLGGRGTDLGVLLHVRALAAACSASGTSSARGRPTGSGFDFVRALLDDPTRLRILGDGTQSKSYVHVDDVVGAMLMAERTGTEAFQVFNVATGDYITVEEIADLAVACVGLDRSGVRLTHRRRPGMGGRRADRGLSTERIRGIGWAPSARRARRCTSP